MKILIIFAGIAIFGTTASSELTTRPDKKYSHPPNSAIKFCQTRNYCPKNAHPTWQDKKKCIFSCGIKLTTKCPHCLIQTILSNEKLQQDCLKNCAFFSNLVSPDKKSNVVPEIDLENELEIEELIVSKCKFMLRHVKWSLKILQASKCVRLWQNYLEEESSCSKFSVPCMMKFYHSISKKLIPAVAQPHYLNQKLKNQNDEQESAFVTFNTQMTDVSELKSNESLENLPTQIENLFEFEDASQDKFGKNSVQVKQKITDYVYRSQACVIRCEQLEDVAKTKELCVDDCIKKSYTASKNKIYRGFSGFCAGKLRLSLIAG